MNILSELNTFNSNEYSCKFFYLYENVATKSLPNSERAEKIVPTLVEPCLNSKKMASFSTILPQKNSKTMLWWEIGAWEVLDPEK